MAWMSDEQYLLMQDTRDKKITARSSRSTRTHCGKGGTVKFPSDYLSKKELNAMNGPVETYRMNSPITWEEFKSYPDEHKKTYIKLLRAKYNTPDTAIAEMFGVGAPVICRYFKCLGLSEGRSSAGSKRTWDKEGFLAWRNGVKGNTVKASETLIEDVVVDPNEAPVEEVVENQDKIPAKVVSAGVFKDDTHLCSDETFFVVPKTGVMTFDGNINDILRTIGHVLNGQNVHLNVTWTCQE